VHCAVIVKRVACPTVRSVNISRSSAIVSHEVKELNIKQKDCLRVFIKPVAYYLQSTVAASAVQYLGPSLCFTSGMSCFSKNLSCAVRNRICVTISVTSLCSLVLLQMIYSCLVSCLLSLLTAFLHCLGNFDVGLS
jgi:hypothetical protein